MENDYTGCPLRPALALTSYFPSLNLFLECLLEGRPDAGREGLADEPDSLSGLPHDLNVRKMQPFKVAPFREAAGTCTEAGALPQGLHLAPGRMASKTLLRNGLVSLLFPK